MQFQALNYCSWFNNLHNPVIADPILSFTDKMIAASELEAPVQPRFPVLFFHPNLHTRFAVGNQRGQEF